MRDLVPRFILEQFARGQPDGRFPATTLFADISGFTTATNAFGQHGKEGSEAMANVMHAIFDPLVQSVYENGGFISGFAGDAFTALFPGWNAQILALTAAVRMRKRMLERSTRITPFGIFRFAIKIGLSDGEVEWGILGGGSQSPHTYYFSGAAIDECAQAEHQAGANEVVVSPSVMERLEPLLGTEPLDGYWRVVDIRTPLPPPRPVSFPAPDPDLLAAFVPQAVLQQKVQGEYRQVLTLFLNLRDILDKQRLGSFVQAVFDLQRQYGGYLNPVDFGDKGCNLILFWGMPTSYENDVERALNFVLELSARTEIPFRAGVTYSLVYAGFVGASLRQEYSCYGQGVNLAARLMVAAPWGSIWLDASAAQRAGHRFELAPQGNLTLHGFADKQPAYALLGYKEEATPFFRGPMVGRQRELAQLIDSVQPVLEGRFAGTLLIRGEVGIGKSRLVHEFQRKFAERDDSQSLSFDPQWFFCLTDQTLHQSLNPFRYLLKHYFRQSANQSAEQNQRRFEETLDDLIARTLDPDLKRELERTGSLLAALVDLHLRDSLYAQLEGQARFENTLQALKALIKAESLYQPMILYIEDAHWLDEDSLQFLQQLVRNVDACPFAVILTARPGPVVDSFQPDGQFAVIELAALGEEDLAVLAGSILGRSPSPLMIKFLADRSDGNPFFAEQMLFYLQEQEEIENVSRLGRTAKLLPLDVRALLVARLDGLPPAVKEVVQGAAVLGREFDARLLAYMLRDDVYLLRKLSDAERAAIWTPLDSMRYLFKNALLCDAAYDMQFHTQRRQLHHRAAESLEALYAADLTPYYRQLAFHYGQAQNEEKECRYAILAGEQAMAQSANDEALRYFGRALELTWQDLPARYALLLNREKIYDLQGNREAQGQDLTALAELAETLHDEQRQAEVALRWANNARMTADYPVAVQHLERGLALARKIGDSQTEMAACNELGIVAAYQGDYGTAVRHLEAGLALARNHSDQVGEAAALRGLGRVAYWQGDLEAADDHLSAGLALYREIRDRSGIADTLNLLSGVCIWRKEYGAAERYLAESLAIAREIGDRYRAADNLNDLGLVSRHRGEYPGALRSIEEGLAIAREVGARWLCASMLSQLGLVYVEMGKAATAWQHLRRALNETIAIGADNLTLAVLSIMAKLFVHAGLYERAAELLGLTLNHPAADIHTQKAAEPDHTLVRLHEVLPAEQLEAALARGQALDLDAVVAEVLAGSK